MPKLAESLQEHTSDEHPEVVRRVLAKHMLGVHPDVGHTSVQVDHPWLSSLLQAQISMRDQQKKNILEGGDHLFSRGTADLTIDKKWFRDKYDAELDSLYLKPQYQGRGIGGATFKRMVGALGELGVDKAGLMADDQGKAVWAKMPGVEFGTYEKVVAPIANRMWRFQHEGPAATWGDAPSAYSPEFLKQWSPRSAGFIRYELDIPKEKTAVLSSLTLRALTDEFAKIAATRYEKEIALGNIARGDVTPGVPQMPGPFNAGSRKLTRDVLQAPEGLQGRALDMKRAVGAKSLTGVAKGARGVEFGALPGMLAQTDMVDGKPLVTVGEDAGRVFRGATEGRKAGALTNLRNSVAQYAAIAELGGATVPSWLKPDLNAGVPKAMPQDGTLLHSVIDHELGEASEAQKSGIRVNATHVGVEPHIRERLRMAGDAAASNEILAARQLHPEDREMSRILRHVGATPDAPIALGGKQQRAVEALMDKSPVFNTVANRARGVQLHSGGFPKPLRMADEVAAAAQGISGTHLLDRLNQGAGGLLGAAKDYMRVRKYTRLGI